MDVHRIRAGSVTLEVAEVEADPDRSGGAVSERRVLLIHGFTGAKEDLSDGLDGLAARGWHALAPDLRGHGGSDQPDDEEAYDPALFVEDLIALVDARGWERFALVGHSMGGALAQRLALDHGDRLAALVLVSTFCGPVAGLDPDLVALGSAIVRQGGLAALAPALAARRDADPALARARRRIEANRAADPGSGDGSPPAGSSGDGSPDARLLACSATMWLALAPRFLTWPDTLVDLASVAIPTLVVAGSEDEAMRGDCERLAAAIPGARLVSVPEVGHSPQLEAPAAFWALVGDFLDGTSAA